MLHDRRKTPPRLRLLNPAASPAVEAVVRRCIEPDPARRYQTAGELHEDLERHLKQLPLRHTSEPSLRERTQKWTQRHARLTAVMSFVLIVGGVSLAIGAHRENKRVTAVEAEVAQLMEAGRQALDDHDVDVAHGRFLAAWMKVQAEPALVDHQPGVAGWLDHSRRAVIQKQWRLRTHPREFDQRRDEALVLSLVLPTSATQQGARQALLPVTVNETGKSVTPTMLGLANAASDNTARDALHAAMDLTVAGDPGWTRERELLTLVEADLTSLESNAERALQHLDETHEFSSRAFHQCRAKLLEQLGRDNEAKQAALMGDQFPSERSVEPFVDGMCLARRQKFDRALNEFETVLDVQPDLFNARLFQAICFLKVNRPSEAKVALTSCIAQRPQFQWSYFFRSQASVALGDEKAARADLQAVLDMNPSETLRQLIALTLRSFP